MNEKKEDISEEQARLFYKNKFVKNFYLYSYVALVVLAFSSVLVAAASLITESGASRNLVAPTLCLALSIADIIVLGVLSALMFVRDDNGYSIPRFRHIDVCKAVYGAFYAVTGGAFLAMSLLGAGGETGWKNFFLGFGVFSIAFGLIYFFYELWRIAWVKENPGRYFSAVKVDEEIENGKVPAKTAKTSAPKAKPEEAKSPKEITDTKEIIEVKAITKKK